MPILAKNNEYVIPLTFKCNWNCSYCAINNTYDYKDTVTDKEILQKIKSIPEQSLVTLTGGEPGLIKKDNLYYYITLLQHKKCELYLETNGLFIKKYPELCKYFYEILYHCSIDMENTNIITNLTNVRYVLIITDENIKNLDTFIHKYNNIKFDIIAASYPYKEQITGPILSEKNKHYILTKYCKHMTKDSIKRMIKEKEFDKINWLF